MAFEIAGRHLLADLWVADPEPLCDPARLAAALRAAAEASGLHPVAPPQVIPFPEGGQGVTGVILLRESHIAVHTYPEHGYLAVDVFTCGATATPERAIDVFIARFGATRVTRHCQARGQPPAD